MLRFDKLRVEFRIDKPYVAGTVNSRVSAAVRERLVCVMHCFPAFGIRAGTVGVHQPKFLISTCVEKCTICHAITMYGGMEVRGLTAPPKHWLRLVGR